MKFPHLIPLLLTLLHCWAMELRAVVVSEAPVVSLGENTATFQWGTDVECGTLLKFGLNKQSLNRKVEGEMGVKHQVQANQLLPGTQYFFSIGTAKKPLMEGTFTTKGSPPKGTPPAAPQAAPTKALPKSDAKAETKAPPSAAPPAASATKPTYTPPSTAKTWGDRYSLQDHFDRHGKDFGAKNPDDYAAKAWLFLQRAMDEGLPAKLDEDGTIRVWEGKSHSFAAYNRDFTTKTFFKPNSGDYFTRQPGKPIRLRHAPSKS